VDCSKYLDLAALVLTVVGTLLIVRDQYRNSRLTKLLAVAILLIFWGFIAAMINKFSDYVVLILITAIGTTVYEIILLKSGYSKSKDADKIDKLQKSCTRPFPESGPQIVYNLAVERWHSQQQQIDSIDAKIGNILGFGGALVAILLGVLAINDKPFNYGGFLSFLISGMMYIFIVIISTVSYFAVKWKAGPGLVEAWKYSREYTEANLLWWAAESFTISYDSNIHKLQLKTTSIRINMILFVIQLLALVIGFLNVAYGKL